MELLHLSAKVKSLVLNLYTVYRIPNTSVLTFCNEMAHVLEDNTVGDRGETILLGDFNIHMDDPVDPDTITFTNFLDSLDLTNLVNFVTHTSNHTLDLVMQSISFKVNSKTLQGHFLLDHAFIHHTPYPYSELPQKNINKTDFKSDLVNINMDEKVDLHHLVEVYNQTLAEILYRHAPLESEISKSGFNDKIKILLRRRLEWRWLKDPTQYNLQSFYY